MGEAGHGYGSLDDGSFIEFIVVVVDSFFVNESPAHATKLFLHSVVEVKV
jgi:hypothetical protein